MQSHWRYLLYLLVQLIVLLTSDSATAQVATFNVSNFVSLTLSNDSATAVLMVEFQLRTSHAAWAVWSMRTTSGDDANSTDQQLMRIGLTSDHLTFDWPGGSNQTAIKLVDGNWHSIRIRLDNASSVTVGADNADAIASLPWSPLWSTMTLLTFGGINGTGGLRGCLANVSVATSVDNVTMVALYGNVTGAAPESSGCREDPCLCANGGRCLARSQWNLHGGCNCSGTAHQGALCQVARDFCQPLASEAANGSGGGERCSNHGQCISVAALETFMCNCTTADWLGSRCQTQNPCRAAAFPCGAHGNCSHHGDPDVPGNLTHRCQCDAGYLGADCSAQLPDSGGTDTRLVVGLVIGILLFLLVVTATILVGKMVRDRRKDTGIYKPSDRELGGQTQGQSMRDILHPPNEERLI